MVTQEDINANMRPLGGREARIYSVCVPCEVYFRLNERRRFGDLDRCPKCGDVMDILTWKALIIALTGRG